MSNDPGDAIRTHPAKILHPTLICDIFFTATITTCNTGSLTRRTSIELVKIAYNIAIVRAKNDQDMALSVSGLRLREMSLQSQCVISASTYHRWKAHP
jgi:hypothetical protein